MVRQENWNFYGIALAVLAIALLIVPVLIIGALKGIVAVIWAGLEWAGGS